MNSLEPGSHILVKKTAYLFDTEFNIDCQMINEGKLIILVGSIFYYMTKVTEAEAYSIL